SANNSYLFLVCLNFYWFFVFLVVVIVCYKSFKPTNTNRLALYSSIAPTLALVLLGADPTTDCWKVIGFCDFFIGLIKVAIYYKLDKFRDFNRNRAAFYTRLVFAVDAPGCFFKRHFCCIACCNFLKVFISYLRVLLRHLYFFI